MADEQTPASPPPASTPSRDGLIGASTVVFDDAGRVLLIERGKPPFKGVWSLPGGHIEAGEDPAVTAAREVAEETGVKARIVGFLTRYDVPVRDARGRVERTLGLAVFYGRAGAGAQPHAAGDVSSARFVALADIDAYPLTENCAELVRAAWARLRNGET